MTAGGVALRFGGLALRVLEFASAAICLGIFSYFLAVLADHNLGIASRFRAVEGITGAATLYAILAILFTLCLGGNAVFGYLAVFLDICFIGLFVYVAIVTKNGAGSCKGVVNTPLGSGLNTEDAPGAGDFGYVCSLNTAVFALSIVLIFLFLISAVWQVLMIRHHQKEKRFGPSPSNNYTKGSGKTPFWKRRRANKHNRDLETTGTIPTTTTTTAPYGTAVRPSHETNTTIGNNAYSSEPKYGEAGYGNAGYGHTPVHHTTTTGNNF